MQTTLPCDFEQFKYQDNQSETSSESQADTGKSPLSILDMIGSAVDTTLERDMIRCTFIENVHYISVYDAIEYLGGQSKGEVRKLFHRLKAQYPEVFCKEEAICLDFKFPGQGQRETPVSDTKNLLKILMLIPGRRSARIREQVVDIANRYYAGDTSLCDDIREINHRLSIQEAKDPTHPSLAFRTSAAVEEEALSEDEKARRARKRKHESKLEEMQYDNRKTALRIERLELHKKEMDLLNNTLGPLASDVERIWIADYCRNQTRLILDTAPVLPGPEVKGVDTSQLTVNVADEAKAMGVAHRGSILKKYGRAAAKAYREKYGEDPPKREQLVSGRPCSVSHYFEKDRGLVREAIRGVVEAV